MKFYYSPITLSGGSEVWVLPNISLNIQGYSEITIGQNISEYILKIQTIFAKNFADYLFIQFACENYWQTARNMGS